MGVESGPEQERLDFDPVFLSPPSQAGVTPVAFLVRRSSPDRLRSAKRQYGMQRGGSRGDASRGFLLSPFTARLSCPTHTVARSTASFDLAHCYRSSIDPSQPPHFPRGSRIVGSLLLRLLFRRQPLHFLRLFPLRLALSGVVSSVVGLHEPAFEAIEGVEGGDEEEVVAGLVLALRSSRLAMSCS